MSTPTLVLDDQEADFIFAMAGKYSRKANYSTPRNEKSQRGGGCLR